METHTTVLLSEAVDALKIEGDSIIVDATLGSAGHSSAILKKLSKDGFLIAFDADKTAIELAQEKFSESSVRIELVHENFRNINKVCEDLSTGEVDGILADLGWRTEQFATGGKGFSFKADEPLFMTFGDAKDYAFVAADIVNQWKEEDIANVLYAYGDERYSRRIARAIVKERKEIEILTAKQLAEIIEKSVPHGYRKGKTHPATKSFQAIRIAVNDELDALDEFLQGSMKQLADNGRLAVISFHSIEDRIVKHAFKKFEHDQLGVVITKKPISPTKEEVVSNPRARSAKLRIFERRLYENKQN